MFCWIEVLGLIVQFAIAVGLGFYTWETWKIRQASHKQNEISQEQIETMREPRLVPLVKTREDIDIVAAGVARNPYPEERVLDDSWSCTGHVALHNIGDGPAFNIQYEIQQELLHGPGQGYLPYILQGGKEPVLQVASNLDPGDEKKEVVFKLSYESFTGCRYESKIHIRRGTRGELVVAKCQFRAAGVTVASESVD